MTGCTILTLLLPPAMLACLNVEQSGLALDGASHRVNDVGPNFRTIMAAKVGDISVRDKFMIAASTALTKESEAVDKILRGDTEAGLKLLQAIEKEAPGNYSIAANIGTAFELAGDNVNALKWIREGISRNPRSHHGTEWLHAFILEAKIAAASAPGELLPGRLLNLPERMAWDTRVMVGGVEHSADDVREALHHQLTERLFFVKPADVLVADLLYSYALVEANLGTTHSALDLLQLAREYGFPDEPLLLQHEKKYRRFGVMNAFKGQVTFYVLLIGGAIVVIYLTRKLVSLCRD